jgi:hypothetical protein
MNEESRFTSSIRQALDESTERLPWRVTHRLEQAREKALARLDAREAQAALIIGHGDAGAANTAPTKATAGDSYLSTNGLLRFALRRSTLPESERPDKERPGLIWRCAVVALPLVVVVSGLIGFSELAVERSANEVAELEAAVLADDVPISAYADRGFGTYLKTSYQPEQ